MISANSRLSPLKPPLLSTPRRELNAAYLAVEKSTTLATIMQIPKENVFIHIDSLVVYWWIKTPPELLKTYVSNRVRKIQDSCFQILFIQGNNNPSDLVSKEKPAKKTLSFWLEGPSLLKRDTKSIIEEGRVLTKKEQLQSKDQTEFEREKKNTREKKSQ